MRFLLIFLLIFVAFFLLMRKFGKWLAGMRGTTGTGSSYRQRQQNTPRKPETQEDRIIGYQKKSFAATQVEDVEFEEMKE
jgi:hypothetical protein